MKKLICEICGGSLIMNADNIAECENCGMKYSKEKVVQMVKIDGAVEVTKGEAEKERLLKNAETFIKLEELEKARNIYLSLAQDYPDDFRGWLGLFSTTIQRSNVSVTDLVACQEYENKLNKLGYPENSTEALWTAIIEEHSDLKIIEPCRLVYGEIFSIIDDFSFELLYFDTSKLKGRLKELQFKVGKNYTDKFLAGEVYFPAIMETSEVYCCPHGKNPYWTEFRCESEVFKALFEAGYENARLLNSLPDSDKTEFWLKFLGHSGYRCHFTFVLSKMLIYSDDDVGSYKCKTTDFLITEEYVKKYINQINQKNELLVRRRNGCCQHCGGEFEGFFTKKCTKCGKEKDY